MKVCRGNRAVNLVTIVLFLFSFAFLLNFLWEALHAVYLYQRHDLDALKYVPMMLYVSSVDGLIVLGLYIFVRVCWRNLFWIKRFGMGPVIAFVVAGLVVATVIEVRAVFYFHKWVYKEVMPTVFGIGISPLVQLSVTGLIAVWLTREIF